MSDLSEFVGEETKSIFSGIWDYIKSSPVLMYGLIALIVAGIFGVIYSASNNNEEEICKQSGGQWTLVTHNKEKLKVGVTSDIPIYECKQSLLSDLKK